MASVDSNMLKDSTVALAIDYYHQPNILATIQWSSSLKNDTDMQTSVIKYRQGAEFYCRCSAHALRHN